MASATSSEKRSWRAICAPREQRCSVSSRWISPPFCTALAIARTRWRTPAAGPVWRTTNRSRLGRPRPTVRRSRLNARSSVTNSSHSRAALLLQPESFSSVA